MPRRRGPGVVSDALQSLMAGTEGGVKLRESLAIAYWPDVVGPQAAEATEAEFVRDGVLFVRTKSSVWSQELTFLKSHIVTELNRRIGGALIREIVFRALGVRKRQPDEDQRDAPQEEELETVVLAPDDQQALDAELVRLAGIPDVRLRTSLARRFERDRRLRRWRLEHGWLACPRCTSVHRGPEPLCPICRVCR